MCFSNPNVQRQGFSSHEIEGCLFGGGQAGQADWHVKHHECWIFIWNKLKQTEDSQALLQEHTNTYIIVIVML